MPTIIDALEYYSLALLGPLVSLAVGIVFGVFLRRAIVTILSRSFSFKTTDLGYKAKIVFMIFAILVFSIAFVLVGQFNAIMFIIGILFSYWLTT